MRWKKKQDEKKKSQIIIIHRHISDFALNMQFVITLNKTTVNKMKSSSWKVIIDSRVTSHIFVNKNLIFNYKLKLFFVETDFDELLKCSELNKAKINMKKSDENTEVTVKNIIWCSELEYNLLSTISLSSRSIEMFLRSQKKSSEFRKNERVFGLADIINNQYVVREDSFNVNLVNIAVSSSILHRRLNYFNWKNVM